MICSIAEYAAARLDLMLQSATSRAGLHARYFDLREHLGPAGAAAARPLPHAARALRPRAEVRRVVDQEADRDLSRPPDRGLFPLEALEDPGFRTRILHWLHFTPQWYYLCDRDGTLLVDHVGRLENFGAFVRNLKQRLGMDIVHRQDNKPARRDYRSYFTTRSARVVLEMYRPDFEILGYPTEPGGAT